MSRPLLVGAGGILVVALAAPLAIYAVHQGGIAHLPHFAAAPPPPGAAPAAPQQAVSQPAPPAQPQAASSGGPAAAPPPSFDVVRVDPKGGTVIAGRAAPDAKVEILDGDRVLAETTADARGEWVALPDKALPAGNRTLRLAETLPGQSTTIASKDDVLIAVPAAKSEAAAPPAAAGAASGALALLVPREGNGMARPLQVPGAASDAAKAPGGKALGLDIVEYDSAGKASLGGRADPGQAVSVYLGNRLIAQSRAAANGTWSVSPEQALPPGAQHLRVDAMGANGKVVARVEVPFQRAAPTPATAGGTFFTVMPGNSLWRIARRSYGAGVRYAVIYAANRSQIANPDLIYPGQVFTLPPAH